MSHPATRHFATIYVDEFDGLTINEIGVLVALRSFGSAENRYPSHKALAERAGTSVTTVQRTLVSLHGKGRLQWVSMPGGNNLYYEGSVISTEVGRSDRPRGVGHIDRQRREVPNRESKTPAAARLNKQDHQEDQGMQVKLDDQGQYDEGDTTISNGTESSRQERKRQPEPSPERKGWRQVLSAWEGAAYELGIYDWNKGLMRKVISQLHVESGYTWDEIELLMGAFFTKEKHTLARRVKEGQDLAVMFRQAFNQGLEARAGKELSSMRTGRPTEHERIQGYERAQVLKDLLQEVQA